MATTTTMRVQAVGAELVPVAEPLFTDGERAALAGFLAGYSGLTRDAYTQDLRRYTSWCAQHGVHLFTAKAPMSNASAGTWTPTVAPGPRSRADCARWLGFTVTRSAWCPGCATPRRRARTLICRRVPCQRFAKPWPCWTNSASRSRCWVPAAR